jgi:glycine/sarcosine N-methyltransferase
MQDSVRDFYDHLAGEYHLIYADWHNAVRRQGAVLDRLLRAHLGEGPHRILDAACGIGTQAIGLALRGHDVRASDISAASVERAVHEAAALGVALDARVADLRDLSAHGDGFDAVIACDNALPHLVEDDDLATACKSMFATLRPGGILVASIRDYDEAVRARSAVTEPELFDGPAGRRIVFQSWDWARDARTYVANLFIAREHDGRWGLTHQAATYRALRRRELSEIARAAGFAAVRWHTTEESGFFQPILTARRPA